MSSLEPSDLSEIIRGAKAQRQCSIGLNETARAIEQGNAAVCISAQDHTEKNAMNLVEALCGENKTPLIKVDKKELLGEWAGLAKLDEEGNVAKARPCGCLAIRSIPAGPAGEKVKAFIASQN